MEVGELFGCGESVVSCVLDLIHLHLYDHTYRQFDILCISRDSVKLRRVSRTNFLYYEIKYLLHI
jgi:hypothetical protein